MKPTQKTSVPKSGYVIGTDKNVGKANVKKLNHHDGIAIGGSVTKARSSASEQAINKLASDRADGRII